MNRSAGAWTPSLRPTSPWRRRLPMPTPAPVTEISLRTIWEATLRRRRFIWIPTLVLTLVAALAALVLPTRYRARAHVAADPLLSREFVQSGREAVPAPEPQEASLHVRRMKEVLHSRGVLESVIRQYKLYPADDKPVREKYLEALKLRLHALAEPDGELFVAFDGASRQQAMEVANRLAEILVERTSAVRDHQATEAGKVVEGELGHLRQKLSEQEQRIKEYKLQAGLAAPDRIETSLKLFETLQTQIEARTAALSDEEAE